MSEWKKHHMKEATEQMKNSPTARQSLAFLQGLGWFYRFGDPW